MHEQMPEIPELQIFRRDNETAEEEMQRSQAVAFFIGLIEKTETRAKTEAWLQNLAVADVTQEMEYAFPLGESTFDDSHKELAIAPKEDHIVIAGIQQLLDVSHNGLLLNFDNTSWEIISANPDYDKAKIAFQELRSNNKYLETKRRQLAMRRLQIFSRHYVDYHEESLAAADVAIVHEQAA